MASEFDEGFLVGILVGEGHFGGDGRRPHITLRMHTRHEAMFRWLERTFPGGKLYGPYEHGARHYYQWMVRGVYLREVVLPLLERHISPTLDRYAYERLNSMRTAYARHLGLSVPRKDPLAQDANYPRPIATTPPGTTASAAPTQVSGCPTDPARPSYPPPERVQHDLVAGGSGSRTYSRADEVFATLRHSQNQPSRRDKATRYDQGNEKDWGDNPD